VLIIPIIEQYVTFFLLLFKMNTEEKRSISVCFTRGLLSHSLKLLRINVITIFDIISQTALFFISSSEISTYTM